ncbi:HK97-gp10 family putative phage morphogenesis protein [Lysinibacillus sp. LZ02]|uniref:HK97-gp10 family putative phage morphogenesis protein n=1 Tax=Lysinibacillus sp. LZ02 TaxID=3420668 RepID=UPI003D35DA86
MSELDTLFRQMKRIPGRSETIINGVLRGEGAQMVMDEIQPNIPLSPLRKKHARTSKALTAKHGNLEFTIRPKRSFEYIKYPDLAIGTSHMNEPRNFMKKGLDKQTPQIIVKMLEGINEEIIQVLGGN